MFNYRPGELDQKLNFLMELRIDDGMGGKETSLISIQENVWCKIRTLSGKEVERFDKLNASEYSVFVTRRRTDIKESDTIQFDNVYYNIRHIPLESTRSMYTEFYAERGVAI